MSFDTIIEEIITEKVGERPCSTEDSLFYYEIASVYKRDDCCLIVVVNLYLSGCLNAIMSKLCQLTTSVTWTFSRDTENVDSQVYTATATFEEICVPCGCDKKFGNNIIETINSHIENVDSSIENEL